MSDKNFIDCFLYDGEYSLLLLRLKLHAPYVKKFIIVQAELSFQGNLSFVPRLNIKFLENKFPYCCGKIFYIYLETLVFSSCNSPVDREILCRQHFSDGLGELFSSDFIIISDVDEIFDFKSFNFNLLHTNSVYKLNMFFSYFLPHYICVTMPWWGSPLAIPAQVFVNENLDLGTLRPVANIKSSLPSNIPVQHIYNCGIHMSFLGGYDDVVRKLSRYSDCPLFACKNQFEFDQFICNGQDVFGRNLIWSFNPSLSLLFSREFYLQINLLPHEIRVNRLPVSFGFPTYLWLLSKFSTPYTYYLLRRAYLYFLKLVKFMCINS